MKFQSALKRHFNIMLLFIAVIMSACNDSSWDEHVTKDELLNSNLAEAISVNPSLTTFESVLKLTGYDKLLESAGSFTVFAPTNDAWAGVDVTNEAEMRKLVGTLIVYKTYFTDNNEIFKTLKSVNGKNLYYDGSTGTFNGAKIIEADTRTANGVIHITDKIIERKDNIWEYLPVNADGKQSQFISSLNKPVMDVSKSVAIGVDPLTGKTKYDTAWTNSNTFFESYPLDNEDSIFTYVVVENTCFDNLYDKYKGYLKMGSTAQTDSATKYNICQDFVFRGKVDITKYDTLKNADGVKVPFKDVVIRKVYDASNGRVYVIEQSNIRLKDKIKPILIQGEDFDGASDANLVFTRYKRWASGERDVAMACAETQADTLYSKATGRRDSAVTKTYFINSGLVANTANFHIEYKANVNSAKYDVYYVAYDDIADHFDPTYTSYGVYKVVQKLYFSMPGAKTLAYDKDNKSIVANNYLGSTRCFVGQGTAGVHELTKLSQWNLIDGTQLIDAPVTTADADVMSVTRAGTMTIWLCNTARSNTAKRQGLLFLDYILLVPRIPEE